MTSPIDLLAPGFIQGLRPGEILLIVLIVLLLFGAKRIPELFRSLGRGVAELKKGVRDVEDDIHAAMDDEPPKRPKAPAHTTQRSSQGSGDSEQGPASASSSSSSASQAEKQPEPARREGSGEGER